MFYRRAVWSGGPRQLLEPYLTRGHNELGTTQLRTFAHGDGEIQGLAFDARPIGFCVHVASYVPHQATSVVPFPSKAKARDTSPVAPPDDYNYLEGDIFFIVSGNHVVLCPSGVRESVAIAYINEMLRKIGEEKLLTRLTINSIVNVDQLKLLHEEGAKKISLNASLYEATLDYVERKTTKMTLLNSLAGDFMALFAKADQPGLRDLDDRENLSIKVEISYDSRKSGGHIGRERLEAAAAMLLGDHEAEGFAIITGKGKRLTADEVRINQKMLLPASGKSILRDATWSALGQYLATLKANGTLQQ